MRPFFTCLISSLLLFLPVLAQQGPVTFAQLKDSMAVHPKPIVIKIYTDWCSYCKMQDMQVKHSSAVQQQLYEKYYYVELNAESRQPIVFHDTAYTFISTGSHGVHALAAKLMHQQAAYPAWIVLDTSWQPKAFHAGMLRSKLLLDFLRTN